MGGDVLEKDKGAGGEGFGEEVEVNEVGEVGIMGEGDSGG